MNRKRRKNDLGLDRKYMFETKLYCWNKIMTIKKKNEKAKKQKQKCDDFYFFSVYGGQSTGSVLSTYLIFSTNSFSFLLFLAFILAPKIFLLLFSFFCHLILIYIAIDVVFWILIWLYKRIIVAHLVFCLVNMTDTHKREKKSDWRQFVPFYKHQIWILNAFKYINTGHFGWLSRNP